MLGCCPNLKFLLLGKKETSTGRHALVMDEVDGMAGNEDRGGIQVCFLPFDVILFELFKEERPSAFLVLKGLSNKKRTKMDYPNTKSILVSNTDL